MSVPNEPMSPLVVLPAMLAFMAMIWVGTLGLFAWIGGWTTWAARFPASGRVAAGEEWSVPDLHGVSLQRGPWLPSTGGGVRLIVGHRGFGLVPRFSNRPFHPPVWVPWHDVASVTEERLMWLFTGVRIEFRDVPHVLRTQRAAGRVLRDNCPAALLVRA
jgi:hypothetical protein